MSGDLRAFTGQYNRRADVLKSDVHISQNLDPKNSPVENEELKKFTAIWDTGATKTAITRKVVDECDLKPIGMVVVHTAGGSVRCNKYLVNVYLPNRVVIPDVEVNEVELVGDSDVLIGMDIIGTGDFAVTNKDGKTTFSFRVPSIEKIDFVEELNKTNKTGKSGKSGKKRHPYAMK